MRATAFLSTIGLSFAVAGCSGGGGVSQPSLPNTGAAPSPLPSATAAADSATLDFHIPLPGSAPTSARKRSPRYIGKTTRSVSIAIVGGTTGNTHYPTVVAKKQCDATGCFFEATDTLPVLAQPYTFTFTAQGIKGILSQGTVTQTLVRGANVVDVTLSPLVATAGLAAPKAHPVPGGPSAQTFAVTVTPYDVDGNAITGTDPFAQPLSVSVFEVDNQGAFVLTPGPAGAADCTEFAGITCNLNSNADSVQLVYNGSANAFTPDPNYYPAEAILYNGSPNSIGNLSFSASNSADISTARCVKPAPICVYVQPYYPLLLAGLNPSATGVIFPATFVAVDGPTIWTDVGVIDLAGSTPVITNDVRDYPGQITGGAQYVPQTANTFTVDYSGIAPQKLDTIASSGAVHPFAYSSDGTSTTSAEGGGIITGPDGNLWWIDPLTASLRVASPSAPSKAVVCILAPTSANQRLSAAQIVSTPAGVTPSRIWFSAVDDISSESYVGYVDASAGSNTCGHATYTAIDAGSVSGPPNGLAVDKNGNAWYNDANTSFTQVGEVTLGSGGALNAPAPIALPAGFVGQAWGIVLDPADGKLYFADDDGTIGRIDPAMGPKNATGFSLPSPLANLLDFVSGPSYNSTAGDASCGRLLTNLQGPCFQQLTWDAGSGGLGRLTMIIPATEFTFGDPSNAPSEGVVTSIDLSGSAVTFSAGARSLRSRAYHYGRALPRHARGGRAY